MITTSSHYLIPLGVVLHLVQLPVPVTGIFSNITKKKQMQKVDFYKKFVLGSLHKVTINKKKKKRERERKDKRN